MGLCRRCGRKAVSQVGKVRWGGWVWRYLSPGYPQMMSLTFLGAQSHHKRCLKLEPSVLWGGHLLMAC